MATNKYKTNVISEELALTELTEFYNHYSLVEKSEEDVKEDLNIALEALKKGLLTFDTDKKPIYTLRDVIKSEDGSDVVLEKIEFKTRIFPNEHIRLSKGLNMQKDGMQFMINCISHLAQFPSVGYVNKLSKFDYTVVQQLSTVFL